MLNTLRAVLLLSLSVQLCLGQNTTAQLTGKIGDASGAAIAAAKIVVTNVDTGIAHDNTSNELGNYTVPLLGPGNYRVQIEQAGFATLIRTGLTLHVDQVARMDFQLQVGAVRESVSVTADAPLLQEGEAALGTVIENSNILEMPLNGRNPFELVFLVPGAVPYERNDLPGNNIPVSNMSINGGPTMRNEVLLDGIPNTSPHLNQYALVPSIDAVQEFKVQTNSMSAEFGRTAGGVINVTMKAGTNQLHLTLYEFVRNSAFGAKPWINKRAGSATPKFVFNQFGFAAGGPIQKNKAFLFTNYEALRRRLGTPFLFSVPTLAQRQGDFTRTLNQNGQLIAVYDPMTTRPSGQGTANIRDAFPGNKIPISRFDPVAAKLMTYWGAPNLPGAQFTQLNNFLSSEAQQYNVNQLNMRVDYNFTSKLQTFGRFSMNSSGIVPPNAYSNIANPASGPQTFTQRNAGMSATYSMTPRTFANFRLGYLRFHDKSHPIGMGFDVTDVGLPAYMRDGVATRTFPSINVNTYTVSNIGFGTSSLGPVAISPIDNVTNTYSAQADVTHIRASHVIKTGYDFRLFRIGGYRPQIPSFTFNQAFTQGPAPSTATSIAGNSIASFLLGTAASGNVQLSPTQDCQSYYMGAFIQDDYKVTRTLTLNIGGRLEYETLRTDRYDRLNWLDFTSPAPLRVPGLGPLVGGLQFAGANGNTRQQGDTRPHFAPRFGFAWQAQRRTTIRGGYGIFVAPRSGGEPNAYGSVGYLATTTYISSLNSILPTAFISDPYPNGFVQPTGNKLGLLTNLGGPITSMDRSATASYVQQWNFNIQRSIGRDMIAEVAYAGSKGSHLTQNLQFNQLPDQYLAMGNALLQSVPNPFYGIVDANQPLGKATTTLSQLLRPYPQFTNVGSVYSPSGSSIYHSMETRLQKRFSRGVTFLASYTNGKLIDDGTGGGGLAAGHGSWPNSQDNNNRRLERSISAQEVSQRFATSYTLQLPVGKGQKFLGNTKGPLGMLVSGWQLNGMQAFQTGRPLAITDSVNTSNSFNSVERPNSTGKSAKLSGPVKDRLNRYFDVAQFTQPATFTFGNVARTLPDVRSPGLVSVDFSLTKNTRIRERANLQFRVEAFNAINRTNYGRPASVFGNPDFGTITSAGDMRILQFGLKLYY